jgi:hypothetical protein
MTSTTMNTAKISFEIFQKLMENWAITFNRCTTARARKATITARKELLAEQGIKGMPIQLMADMYEYSLQA